MSITPGWEEKEFSDYTPGVPVTFSITQDGKYYYIDNGQEFKRFDTWAGLCEELKGFTP